MDLDAQFYDIQSSSHLVSVHTAQFPKRTSSLLLPQGESRRIYYLDTFFCEAFILGNKDFDCFLGIKDLIFNFGEYFSSFLCSESPQPQ